MNTDASFDRDRRLELVDDLLAPDVSEPAASALGASAPLSQQPGFAAALGARRRAVRRGLWMRGLLLALALTGLAIVYLRGRGSETEAPHLVPPVEHPDPVFLVHSRPLGDQQRISSNRSPGIVTARTADRSFMVVRRSEVAVVSTVGPAIRIDDEQLLAAFAGQPLALIERAPGRKELVFLAMVAD